MARRYITPHFAPANNTLAVVVSRASDDLVAKLTVEKDSVLKASLVSVIGDEYFTYRSQPIGIRAGRTVYFVQSGFLGLSYLVVEKADGYACSCKDARNGLPCQHISDVASFEARCLEQEQETIAAKIARVAEEVGVPVGEVALIARLAGYAVGAAKAEKAVDPVSEAETFIAWVLQDRAAKAGYAA